MSDTGRSGAPRHVAGDGVPELLRTRLREALDEAPGADVARPTPEDCLAAGERLLTRVLHADDRSRETAIDLLTADALVTHAFELAADDPERIDALAAAAMARIATANGR
ncbi:MAG TPA: hypothetical protein VFS08_04810 [Gemmatimonadaceae bacterium]|nr:hypothetical protein [Gemmatimonadaceae bacterium]